MSIRGTKLVGIAAGLAFVIAVPTAALSLTSGSNPPYDLAVLKTPQEVSDLLPGVVLQNAGDELDTGSSRTIRNETGRAWAVVNLKGELCLVVSESAETGSMTCTTSELFSSSGIGLQVWNEGQGAVEYYLMPDTVASDGENLISVDPASPTKVQDIYALANGEAFESTRFTPRVLPLFDEAATRERVEP